MSNFHELRARLHVTAPTTTDLTAPVNWQPWTGSQNSFAGLMSVSTAVTGPSRYFRLSE